MSEPRSHPAWTVAIPTHDRPDQLRQTVHAANRMHPPPGGFEILVVDDGGQADLSHLDSVASVRLHRQDHAGPAAARNTAAALAHGLRLAFTDDDCRPAADWLVRLHAALDDHPEALVGGHTVNALARNPFSAASQDVVDYLYRVQNRDPANARFFASNNIAAARETFLEVGGFDVIYPLAAGEDRAFCERWRRGPRRLVYVPCATVEHYHALTWRSYWRQHFRYGRGAYTFNAQWRRDRATQGRFGAERLDFYLGLLAQPYQSQAPRLAAARVALLALAQVATATGFAAQARQSRHTRRAPGASAR